MVWCLIVVVVVVDVDVVVGSEQRAARVADINRTRLARDGRFEISEGDAEGIPESFNKRPSVGQPLQYRKSGEEVRRRDLTPTEQAA